METSSSQKIWRYMNFEKFISLVINNALYFTCPNQFDDPYEGYYKKAQIEASSEINQKFVNDFISFRNQAANKLNQDLTEANDNDVEAKVKSFIDTTDDILNKAITDFQEAPKKASLKFGVSCWHKSEYESEAMWKIYSCSGQGIAIESTTIQLTDSISSKIQTDSVRYCDFDNDKIEKGHRFYGLFQKRKSFKYEEEFRATIMLDNQGTGMQVPCNLDVLINKIYVSPFLKQHVRDDIEILCKKFDLNKPIIRSMLFDKPNYKIALSFDMHET